jgi:hypothetical protein
MNQYLNNIYPASGLQEGQGTEEDFLHVGSFLENVEHLINTNENPLYNNRMWNQVGTASAGKADTHVRSAPRCSPLFHY